MLRTKFKYENKQRAITQKISKRELWFLYAALRLDEIYPPMKFHIHSQHSLGDMLWTKNGGRRLPARPPTMGDNIIRLVFDRPIKRRKCWKPAFSPFPAMFSTLPRTNLWRLANG